MDDLIARLESAESGSRELDALIAVALRSAATDGDMPLPEWADENFPTWRARPDGKVECVHADGTGGLNWRPARFTTSVDDALALVPEGYFWAVSGGLDHIGAPRGMEGMFSANVMPVPFEPHNRAWAKHPALALCIAILKAKEA